MADIAYKGFKWNRAGYAELMNSSGVQALVADKATAIKARADASVGEGDAHEIHDATHLKLARGRLVVTATKHAMRAEAKRKSLTTAIGG